MNSGIEASERVKYAELFQVQCQKYGDVNGVMSGKAAHDLLLKSGLRQDQLERIWDISDIDQDGGLDFEEFCIAMHMSYDCLNGHPIPATLPTILIPPQKAHLIQNNNTYPAQITYQATGYQAQHAQAPSQQQPMTGFQPQPTGFGSHYPSLQSQPTGFQPVSVQPTGYSPQPSVGVQPQATGFQHSYTGYGASQGQMVQRGYETEFSWDLTENELSSYQDIYSRYANDSGKVKFRQLEDYYATLGLSRNDLTNAWSLVNVNHAMSITQDQCIMYFHVLNQRARGAPIPKELPPDLQEAFAGEYAIDLGERPGYASGGRKGNNQPMSKSAELAEGYVKRLGTASTSLSSKGSSHSGHKYDEEEMLRRELDELKQRVKEAEQKAASAKENEESNHEIFASRPLKDQFQALYDYKLRQLTDQTNVEEKIRRQERDIEAARDAVRRLERIRDGLRDKKREMEALLEERRSEVQKAMRSTERY